MQFFKVTTYNRRSLGLRNNPTILTFPLGKWVKSPTIKKCSCDDGGIWVASSLSNAKRLKKYMMIYHKMKCRIFRVTIGQILWRSSYRIKTDRIRCEVEIR